MYHSHILTFFPLSISLFCHYLFCRDSFTIPRYVLCLEPILNSISITRVGLRRKSESLFRVTMFHAVEHSRAEQEVAKLQLGIRITIVWRRN